MDAQNNTPGTVTANPVPVKGSFLSHNLWWVFSINGSTTQLRFSQAFGKNRTKACLTRHYLLVGWWENHLTSLILRVIRLESCGPKGEAMETMVPGSACFSHGSGVSEASEPEPCHGDVGFVMLAARGPGFAGKQLMLPKPSGQTKRKKIQRNWLAEKVVSIMAISLESWPRVGPFCGNDPVNCYQPCLMTS